MGRRVKALGLRVGTLAGLRLLRCLRDTDIRIATSTGSSLGQRLLKELQLGVGLLSVAWMDLTLERVQSFSQLFDISDPSQSPIVLWYRVSDGASYPLLGPLFMGWRLKAHGAPVRLQLEQAI